MVKRIEEVLKEHISKDYIERLTNKKAFYIGIDSGTYRTRAVGSNGVMAETLSFVGILKRHFGVQTLIGQEALNYRTELDQLIRPIRYGYLFSLDRTKQEQRELAYGYLMRYLKNKIVPQDFTGPVIAVVSIPIIDETEEGIKNRNLILDLLERKEKLFDCVQLVPQPFAGTVGASTDIPELSEYTVAVDQGAGTSAIALVRSIKIPTYPKYQIKTIFAGDRKDEMFAEKVNKKLIEKGITDIEGKIPEIDVDTARVIKERYDFVGDENIVKVPYTFVSRRGPVTIDISAELKSVSEAQLNEIALLMLQVRSRLPVDEQDKYTKCVMLGEGSRIKGIAQFLQMKLREYLPSDAKFAKEIIVKAGEQDIFDNAKGALIYALNTDEEFYRGMGLTTI